MKIIIPHHKTAAAAQAEVDRASGDLFGLAGPIQIVDQKKQWNGPVMDFSFSARYGFVSIPITGKVTVDDHNVTIECELPSLVKQFMGEDKLRASIEKKFNRLLT